MSPGTYEVTEGVHGSPTSFRSRCSVEMRHLTRPGAVRSACSGSVSPHTSSTTYAVTQKALSPRVDVVLLGGAERRGREQVEHAQDAVAGLGRVDHLVVGV